jgi:hypothetical protein
VGTAAAGGVGECAAGGLCEAGVDGVASAMADPVELWLVRSGVFSLVTVSFWREPSMNAIMITTTKPQRNREKDRVDGFIGAGLMIKAIRIESTKLIFRQIVLRHILIASSGFTGGNGDLPDFFEMELPKFLLMLSVLCSQTFGWPHTHKNLNQPN